MITVKEVRRAYKKLEAVPVNEITFVDINCMCPLSALYLANNNVKYFKNYNSYGGTPNHFVRCGNKTKNICDATFNWSHRKYGKEFICGFLGGFDHENPPIVHHNKNYMRGLVVGKRIRKSLGL